jgi:hypothetical protein
MNNFFLFQTNHKNPNILNSTEKLMGNICASDLECDDLSCIKSKVQRRLAVRYPDPQESSSTDENAHVQRLQVTRNTMINDWKKFVVIESDTSPLHNDIQLPPNISTARNKEIILNEDESPNTSETSFQTARSCIITKKR